MALKGVAAAVDPLFGSFPGPRILIYHQVGVSFGREMEITTDTFSRQLDWIQANGRLVDLETAIARRNDEGSEELFVLTFDDGFEDVYKNAFPMMREREIPFTLYLTTKPIETGEPLDPKYPDARPLNWEEVGRMIASGLVTIGAHTHTHPDLRKVSPDQIVEELDHSNRLILERTGVHPRHFTYPWGWWSQTADLLVRERYFSSTAGAVRKASKTSEPHLVARVPVQRSDSLRFFECRTTHGLRLEEGVRNTLARFR